MSIGGGVIKNWSTVVCQSVRYIWLIPQAKNNFARHVTL
jgi:hypothetical protein